MENEPKVENREELVIKALELLNRDKGWSKEDLNHLNEDEIKDLISFLSKMADPESMDEVVATATPEDE